MKTLEKCSCFRVKTNVFNIFNVFLSEKMRLSLFDSNTKRIFEKIKKCKGQIGKIEIMVKYTF